MYLDKYLSEIFPSGVEVGPRFFKMFKEISGWENHSHLLDIQQKAFCSDRRMRDSLSIIIFLVITKFSFASMTFSFRPLQKAG